MAHPSAATPGFVAHAPVSDAKRLSRTVLDAFFGERASRRHVAILDPVAHFLRRAAAHVSGEVWFRANETAETDEFVRAEAAVLHVAAPVNVDALGSRFGGSDAVAPVIVVRVAAAGPAQNRDAQFFQILDRLAAIAVDIRNWRIFPDP